MSSTFYLDCSITKVWHERLFSWYMFYTSFILYHITSLFKINICNCILLSLLWILVTSVLLSEIKYCYLLYFIYVWDTLEKSLIYQCCVWAINLFDVLIYSADIFWCYGIFCQRYIRIRFSKTFLINNDQCQRMPPLQFPT